MAYKIYMAYWADRAYKPLDIRVCYIRVSKLKHTTMNVQTHEEVARNAAEISQDAARVSTSAAKVAADQEFQATRERAAELAAEAKAKGTAAFEQAKTKGAAALDSAKANAAEYAEVAKAKGADALNSAKAKGAELLDKGAEALHNLADKLK